jgi:hypothetical protein
MKLKLALLASFTAAVTMPAFAVPQIEVDGQILGGPPCVVQSGSTLVPLRSIFERLGASVNFAAATSTITAEKINSDKTITKIVLKLGSKNATVRDLPFILTTPAQVIGGSTYVPLRFVAEALGTKVSYISSEQKVVIVTGAQPAAVAPTPGKADPFDATLDIKRLSVGNQGGILKIWDRTKKQVLLFRGIDDRGIAALNDQARSEIFATIGVEPTGLSIAAQETMQSYSSLPKKECLALLGAIGSSPTLAPTNRTQIQAFVCGQLSSTDVAIRRQALLSLAIMGQPTASTTEQVVRLFETSENLWETFPVQQFFEYNAAVIPNANSVRQRVSKVSSLYTPYLLGYLDAAGTKPALPVLGN